MVYKSHFLETCAGGMLKCDKKSRCFLRSFELGAVNWTGSAEKGAVFCFGSHNFASQQLDCVSVAQRARPFFYSNNSLFAVPANQEFVYILGKPAGTHDPTMSFLKHLSRICSFDPGNWSIPFDHHFLDRVI